MALLHPGHVAQHVDREREGAEGDRGEGQLARPEEALSPHHQHEQAQEAQAQRLVHRVERARPRKRPASSMPFTGSRSSQHRPQDEEGGRHLEQHGEDVRHGDPLWTRYTPSHRRHVVARIEARSLASARRAKV